MNLDSIMQKAVSQMNRQREALRMARAAAEVDDPVALALCLHGAALITAQCANTLLAAVAEVTPRAGKAAQALPSSEIN